MKIKIFTLFFISSVVFTAAACSGDDNANTGVNTECTYSLNPADTKIKWTAYKFTEKSGVGGSFEKYTIENAVEADSPLAVIENATIKIQTPSVETGVDDRDKKIADSFFGTMQGSEITGTIEGVSGQTGNLVIEMNGEKSSIPVQFKVEGNTVALTGSLDVNSWNAGESLAALNKVCELLHTGSDGVSKLWPTVDIEASAKLNADCQ